MSDQVRTWSNLQHRFEPVHDVCRRVLRPAGDVVSPPRGEADCRHRSAQTELLQLLPVRVVPDRPHQGLFYRIPTRIFYGCVRENPWPGRHPRSNFVVRSYPAIVCRKSWSWACGIIFRRKLCSMFMMQVRAAGIGVRILSDPHPSCGSGPHHFNGSGRIHIILTDPVGSAPFLRIRSIFTDPVGSLPVPFLRSRSDPHHFCGSGRIHTILTISFGSTPLWHALRENGGNINNSGQLGIWNGKSVPHQNSRSPKFWNVVLLCVTCTQEESCCSIWSFPGSSWSWSASGRTGPSSPTRLPSRRIIYQKTYLPVSIFCMSLRIQRRHKQVGFLQCFESGSARIRI